MGTEATIIRHLPVIKTLALGNLRIAYHDSWCKFLINGQTLPLTPTECRICISFLREPPVPLTIQSQEELMLVSYISADLLQTRITISHRQLLRKHISNCNAKLAPYGLHIAPFAHGYVMSLMPLSQAS